MNRWIWFNIGQKGDHYVTWHCGVINENFDPKTIRIEDCIWDKNNNPQFRWVKKEEMNCKFHRSVEHSFDDLEKVSKWVKQSYESGEDVYVGGRNWLHIYDVFDMSKKNEYGVGEVVTDWK